MSISENHVLVEAANDDGEKGIHYLLYIMYREFSLQSALPAANRQPNDYFGSSVAMYGVHGLISASGIAPLPGKQDELYV